MRHFVGIDLGTTNSVICTYDGKTTHVWKSPDQSDVTPSAIFVDRRGNRYYGRSAYQKAPMNEKNAATLFKRYMGTKERFLTALGLNLTPEACSAEILKLLYSYLPEEIRLDPETVTVITVPAAFNQMKKDATLEAAQMAGIGRVALMQEPVAAIMSVMRKSQRDGIFLVYDLGGGTFDVSIAENFNGKVNLLTQGGKEMCGGRDWDRRIYNSVIYPWLDSTFDLPQDFHMDKNYRRLRQMALFAADQAKIELSSRPETVIRMDESELNCKDLRGEEIYIDIPLERGKLDALIADIVDETIQVTRETMDKAGLIAADIEQIVFTGGPSNYKPLRDRVSEALAIPVGVDVNPMTAVAEGASIFAESIDWTDARHNRKATSGQVQSSVGVSLRYVARTSDSSARIAFFTGGLDGLFVEMTCPDTGWSSGQVELRDNLIVPVPLERDGKNTFEVSVYDSFGRPVYLEESRITIIRTTATVGAIPASHSIGAEVLSRKGGAPELVFFVRKDDPLPSRGQFVFRAGETLEAGSYGALKFNLWEGEIVHSIRDNRHIGTYKIPGTSLERGVIPEGADIICDYEVSDSGTIHLGVSIPHLGIDLKNENFYSRQEGQTDLGNTDRIADGAQNLSKRIDDISPKISDPRLELARAKVRRVAGIGSRPHDQEDVQAAENDLLDAKRLYDQAYQEHLREFRQLELDHCVQRYHSVAKERVSDQEMDAFDNLARAAQRSIDRDSTDFDGQLSELENRTTLILWQQDWFVIDIFNYLLQCPYAFPDQRQFEALKAQGQTCLREDRIGDLRGIVLSMLNIKSAEVANEGVPDNVNVIKG